MEGDKVLMKESPQSSPTRENHGGTCLKLEVPSFASGFNSSESIVATDRL